MAITNIHSRGLWAVSSGQHEISTTIARSEGQGSAFAEAALSRVTGGGAAYAWISGVRYQASSDEVRNEIAPDPDGAFSARWVANFLSVTVTLRVVNCYAFAVAKLSPWE
ncbi:hypothetical protein ABZ297_44860 [Nonomuraea sp. NPDC005983]|uniref:hypothetical protein n=1 Tax=Nonomuraea sp. NPDC005983 TaxID=3155595 RepID=UPI0033A53E6E